MAFVHERCVWLGVRARTLRMAGRSCTNAAYGLLGASQWWAVPGALLFFAYTDPQEKFKMVKKGLKNHYTSL